MSDSPQAVQKSDQSCSNIIVGHDWSFLAANRLFKALHLAQRYQLSGKDI